MTPYERPARLNQLTYDLLTEADYFRTGLINGTLNPTPSPWQQHEFYMLICFYFNRLRPRLLLFQAWYAPRDLLRVALHRAQEDIETVLIRYWMGG
jgi:hypothetical protein